MHIRFEDHEVDLVAACALSMEGIKDLGITAMGDRARLFAAFKDMKETSDAVKSCQKNMSNDASPEKLLESITKAEQLENFPADLVKEARAKLRIKEEV